jgi:lysozyme
MITSLEDQLTRDEGVRYSAYLDSMGWTTIGVGRLIDARRGGRLSADEVNYLLKNDVSRVRQQVADRLPWVAQLDEIRRAVLHNMAFQLGVNGLCNFVRTLALVKAGDYAGAAAEMLDSAWAKQTPERAQRLSQQMETGQWQ